jgi:hypothetical protein
VSVEANATGSKAGTMKQVCTIRYVVSQLLARADTHVLGSDLFARRSFGVDPQYSSIQRFVVGSSWRFEIRQNKLDSFKCLLPPFDTRLCTSGDYAQVQQLNISANSKEVTQLRQQSLADLTEKISACFEQCA